MQHTRRILSRRSLNRLVVLSLAPLFAACAGGDAATEPGEGVTPSVASVRVSPDSIEAAVGESVKLDVTVLGPSNRVLAGETVSWQSSDTTVATVDATGNVSVLEEGAVQISATAQKVTGSAKVKGRRTAVASVVVSPSSASLTVGQGASLSAVLRSSQGNVLNGRTVIWSSTNAAVASVNSSGRVTASAVGTATIRATSEGIVGSSAITVTTAAAAISAPGTVATLAVASVTGTAATLRFTEVSDGASGAASYVVRYAPNPISWGSANVVTAGSCQPPIAGTTVGAVRSCTVEGLTAATAYQFQVVAFRGTYQQGETYGALSNVASATTTSGTAGVIASLAVTPTTASTSIGGTQAFTAVARDAAGNVLSGQSMTWSSTAPAVATVTAAGVATGVAAGSTTIRVTSGSVTGAATLTVAAGTPSPVASITLSPTSASVSVGQTRAFVATLRDASGNTLSGRTITWSSTAPAIASVSSAGVATALMAGSTTIRASAEGITGSAAVTVTAPAVATQLVITQQPGGATLGNALSPQPVVQLRDANNQLVAGNSVVTASIASGSGTLQGTTSVTAVNGVASFTNLAIGGNAGTHSLRFAASGLVSATSSTFSIATAPTGGGQNLLSVNWGTATGNSVTAVTDGGKGITRWCDWSPVLSVRAGSTLGWTRTANVLSIRSIQSCGHIEFDNLFPTPAQGQFWAVKYYIMNGVGQTDTKMHPLTHFPVGAIEAVHTSIWSVGGGNWNHGTGWPGGPDFPWYAMNGSSRRLLSADTWYRFEYIIQWLDGTRFRVFPRLYDMAGNMLNDQTTWQHSNGAGTLASWYAAGNSFAAKDPQHMRNLSFGMGQSGSSGGYYNIGDVRAALVSGSSAFIGQ